MQGGLHARVDVGHTHEVRVAPDQSVEVARPGVGRASGLDQTDHRTTRAGQPSSVSKPAGRREPGHL